MERSQTFVLALRTLVEQKNSVSAQIGNCETPRLSKPWRSTPANSVGTKETAAAQAGSCRSRIEYFVFNLAISFQSPLRLTLQRAFATKCANFVEEDLKIWSVCLDSLFFLGATLASKSWRNFVTWDDRDRSFRHRAPQSCSSVAFSSRLQRRSLQEKVLDAEWCFGRGHPYSGFHFLCSKLWTVADASSFVLKVCRMLEKICRGVPSSPISKRMRKGSSFPRKSAYFISPICGGNFGVLQRHNTTVFCRSFWHVGMSWWGYNSISLGWVYSRVSLSVWQLAVVRLAFTDKIRLTGREMLLYLCWLLFQ